MISAIRYFFPEVAAAGYTRIDGTIEFYTRINALIGPGMKVVDFGAGRGQGAVDDLVPFRKSLRILKGKCDTITGIDVDEAVHDNGAMDSTRTVGLGEKLPFGDCSIDMIVSDHVFEHIENPEFITGEFIRVLKPGGWICSRTPNRWGYIGIGTNLIPNNWHASWLRFLQPRRKEIDVFPTRYKLNTRRLLRKYFPIEFFRHMVYGHVAEPAYMGNSKLAWMLMLLLSRITPQFFAPTLMIFIRKHDEA